ncbi:GGDEF domain-containing protein [Paenibacillus sp.]|uniref:GGDEF domain-containing protein n=1 Tax=Paenibacillus sp. TaxID=58172 RepID=UPI002D3C0BCD|nr:GGDEF domain-containing protein [Paenibacillus sp.]HZG58373.1 GGDEF domain-containing protein [Paenibacillus sp.]
MDSLVFKAWNKANVGMMVVDRERRIVLWNHWLERCSGLRAEEVLGRPLADVCPRFRQKAYEDILSNALFRGQSRFCSSTLHKSFILPKHATDDDASKQNMNVEPLTHEGEAYALIQISDMTNMYDRVYKLKNLIREMEVEYSEIKSSEEMNRHLALHDSLTELPNRMYFNERLTWAVNYAKRSGERLAVMFLDLDGFKEVNDAYGHEIGDRILQETAARLKSCIRSTDTIARLGGDEFVVLLSQLKEERDAEVIARKFVDAFGPGFKANGAEVRLSVSVGISLYPRDGREPTELVNKADQAMYKIKSAGKNAFGYVQ